MFLSSEIKQLKKENQRLKEENEKLKQEKQKIEDEKQKIVKEFEEFKLKHLGTVDELKKAMHLKPNLSTKKKGVGAQKGHTAYVRHIPERIDHIQEHTPKNCPACGEQLPKESVETRQRYITDIKFIISVENTQHNIHRKYCKKCKKIVEPPLAQALPRARFGLNLMLFIMYLRVGLRLPLGKVQEFLQTVCNIDIGRGEITLILQQLARAYGPHYHTLTKIVRAARVKYTDTTSWRTDAKNYAAWVFITTGAVLYKITRKGNADVPAKIFGKKQHGNKLVVDRHAVNRCLAEKLGFILQFCWSHILDDSRGLAKNFGTEGRYVHRKLKQIFEDAKSLNHKGTETQVKELEKRIIALTTRRYTHSTVRKWVKNLAVRDLHGLFIFVTDPDVDPTNNISERKLRTLVIFRKITNGSRSVTGAETTAILFSVLETLKHTNINPLQGLHQILKNPSQN